MENVKKKIPQFKCVLYKEASLNESFEINFKNLPLVQKPELVGLQQSVQLFQCIAINNVAIRFPSK